VIENKKKAEQGAAAAAKGNSFTELDSLSTKAAKSREYFNNPVLDMAKLEKISFLQIENIYINNVRQW